MNYRTLAYLALACLALTFAPACGGDNASGSKKGAEICNNTKDDDGDKLVDCDDPSCEQNVACKSPQGACGDGVKNGAEVCDTNDLAGATCATQGFTGGTLACNAACSAFNTAACTGTSSVVCGNNTREGSELCDGSDLAAQTCLTRGFTGGTLACGSGCQSFVTSGCTGGTATCGNNDREAAEVCDGSDLDGQTCQSRGFGGGTLSCAADCTRFVTSSCTAATTCGNNTVENPEVCDGTALASKTCVSLGFSGGTLACSANCASFNTSACTGAQTCGNNTKEGTEVCDGTALAGQSCASIGQGFTGGTLTCAASCAAFNTSACTTGAATCGNGAIDGGAQEVCDGTNLGTATCASLGFKTGTLACAASCKAFNTAQCTGTAACGNGVIDGFEICDGSAWGFYGGPSCADFGLGTGNATCSASCTPVFTACQQVDLCEAYGWYNESTPYCDPCERLGGHADPDCITACAQGGGCGDNFNSYAGVYSCTAAGRPDPDCGTCGNGSINGGELCDGATFFNASADSCAEWGFSGGTLGCRADCVPNFAACTKTTCGDGQIQGYEACDGTNYGGATCGGYGYGAGSLACVNNCLFHDTAQCDGLASCGNGVVDGVEACDKQGSTVITALGNNTCAAFGYGSGNLGCTSGCALVLSGCSMYDGTAPEPAAPDYCKSLGYYNDGAYCDACELLGGTADPDCAALCGADTGHKCADYYTPAADVWSCVATRGAPDPDCGACGNGLLEGSEYCDGTQFADGFGTCQAFGFVGGTLSCRADCAPNLAACTKSTCGNGTREGYEVCDGAALGSPAPTCASLGYKTGSVTCKSDCSGYVTTACVAGGVAACGNGRLDSFESCDGTLFAQVGTQAGNVCTAYGISGAAGQAVTCNADCTLNFSACTGTSDFCTFQTRRSDGVCDLCQLFPAAGGGGSAASDSECATKCTTLDGVCHDYFDSYFQRWACKSQGLVDPDCGYCGNGSVEYGLSQPAGISAGEYCDATNLADMTCATYGYTGGTLSCRADCIPNFVGCTL